jgi:hypothetical protein
MAKYTTFARRQHDVEERINKYKYKYLSQPPPFNEQPTEPEGQTQAWNDWMAFAPQGETGGRPEPDYSLFMKQRSPIQQKTIGPETNRLGIQPSTETEIPDIPSASGQRGYIQRSDAPRFEDFTAWYYKENNAPEVLQKGRKGITDYEGFYKAENEWLPKARAEFDKIWGENAALKSSLSSIPETAFNLNIPYSGFGSLIKHAVEPRESVTPLDIGMTVAEAAPIVGALAKPVAKVVSKTAKAVPGIARELAMDEAGAVGKKGYSISPKETTFETKYGISSESYHWPANKVKIADLPNNDIVVYKTKSGWIVADKTTGSRMGKERAGIGWKGFATKEEAVQNYIAKVKPVKQPLTAVPKPVPEGQAGLPEARQPGVEGVTEPSTPLVSNNILTLEERLKHYKQIEQDALKAIGNKKTPTWDHRTLANARKEIKSYELALQDARKEGVTEPSSAAVPATVKPFQQTIGEGLNSVSIRELPNGKFQVTPSYNQQTKGVGKQLFNSKVEALNFVSPTVAKNATVQPKPAEPPVQPPPAQTIPTKSIAPPAQPQGVQGAIPKTRRPIWEGKTDVQGAPAEIPVKEPIQTAMPSGRKPPDIPPSSTTPVDWQPSGKQPGGISNQKPIPLVDNLKRAEESLDPETKSFWTIITDAKDKINRAMYQTNRPIKALSNKVNGMAWKLTKVVPGARTWGERLVEKTNAVTYRKAGKDLKNFATYVVLKRNEDILAKYGQGTKLANNVQGWGGNQLALNALQKRLGAERFAKIEQLAKEFWINNEENTIGALYKAGLIDQNEYLALKTSYPHYVPFGRQGYDKNVIDSIKSVANVSSDGIQQMEETGSIRKLLNVLASEDSNVIKVQERIAKNEAAKAIITDLETLGKQTGKSELSWVANPDVPKDTLVSAIHDNTWDTVSYLKDGKLYTANVPKMIAVAAKAMEESATNPLLRGVRALAMPLMKGAVVYNPSYLPVNKIRDAFSAYFREGLIPLSPSDIRGWKAAFTRNAWFDEATKAGTLNSGIVETMLKSDKIQPVTRQIGSIPLNNLGDYLLSPARFMEKVNLTTEQSTRLAVYIKKRKMGFSKLDSAVGGRDATVDFAQTGTLMRDINMVIPFSNASLQGAVNTLRTFKDKPLWAATVAGTFMVPTAICRANNMKYETSKDIPYYEYTNNWVFQVGEYSKPDGIKGPIYVKFPKGQIAAMLTFPAEAGFNYQQSKDDKSLLNVFLEAGRGALESTSPVPTDISGILPPLAETAVDIATNTNMYTKQPIVSQSEQNLLPEQQFDSKTGKVAIAIGQQFKVSPKLIDFAIKNYTAGTGQAASWLIDLGLGGLGYNPEVYGQSGKPQSGLSEDISKAPVANRFIGTKATQEVREGYEKLNTISEETNRKFNQIPGVNALGVRLGDAGSSIDNIDLTPQQQAAYQQVISDTVLPSMPTIISKANTIPQAKRRDYVMDEIARLKTIARNKFAATLKSTGQLITPPGATPAQTPAPSSSSRIKVKYK